MLNCCHYKRKVNVMINIFLDLSGEGNALITELCGGEFVFAESADCADVTVTDKADLPTQKAKLLRIISTDRLEAAAMDTADDIILAPVNVRELKVRISRLIAPENRIFEKGELKIDLSRAEVTVNGERIHLTLIEYRFLALLAKGYGRLVPYKEILTSVWECPLGNEMQSVRVFVNAIRHKFATAGATEEHIITHASKGYQLK